MAVPTRLVGDLGRFLREVVRGPASDHPMAWDHTPEDVAAYCEPWLAWEHDGAVAGLAWDASIARIENHWHIAFLTRELSVCPGERSSPACLALYVGDGDWRDVRRMALRWAGVRQSQKKAPTVRRSTVARVEPGVLATTSDEAKGRLVVDTISRRPVNGQVSLEVGRGLSVEPRTTPVSDLVRGQAIERDLRFALPKDRLGVFSGRVRLELALDREVRPFHVLRLGTQAPVAVRQGQRSGQEIWTIDNGSSTFVIAPAFGPSIIAWDHGGLNQLYSPFPEPQGFGWVYPWLGGIHSTLLPLKGWEWEGYLSRKPPTAEAVETVDGCGLAWRGLRLVVRPSKKKREDIEIEIDYLTLGKADLLKYVLRLRNLRATKQVVRISSTVACRLGAEPAELSARSQDVNRTPTNWYAEIAAGHWGALANDRTGQTMLMVGTQPDVTLWDAGQAGRVLGAGDLIHLAGDEVHERVYYLVLAGSLEQAKAYRALKDYAGRRHRPNSPR